MPVRSRRSMKIRPPWSRRRWTQPATRSPRRPSPQHLAAPGVAVAVGPQGRRRSRSSPRSASPLPLSPRSGCRDRPARCSPRRMSRSCGALGLEDSDAAGAEAVRVLQLALEAAPGEVDLGGEAGFAQFAGQDQRPAALLGATRRRLRGRAARTPRPAPARSARSPPPSRPPGSAGRRAARPGRRSGHRRRSPTGLRAGRRRRRRSCACSSRGRAPGSGRSSRRRRPRRAAPRTSAKCSASSPSSRSTSFGASPSLPASPRRRSRRRAAGWRRSARPPRLASSPSWARRWDFSSSR